MDNDLLQKIKNNDMSISDVYITTRSLYDNADLLIDALESNTHVKTILLCCDWHIPNTKTLLYILNGLTYNTTVTRIILSNKIIRGSLTIGIRDFIKTTSTIKFLRLNKNVLGDDETIAILAEGIKTNTSIETLSLSDNEIGNKGAKILGNALEINRSITDIDLYSNKIGDEGVIALTETLKINTNIRKLCLFANQIGPKGAIALSPFFKSDYNINIDIGYNKINDEGCISIMNIIKKNPFQKTIYFYRNNIRTEGIKVLSEYLKFNSTVKIVDLAENKLGDEEAIMLAESIKINRTLDIINLPYNRIGDKGIIALAESLKFNYSMRKIILHGPNIGEDGEKAIIKLLQHNYSIKYIGCNNNIIEKLLKPNVRTQRIIEWMPWKNHHICKKREPRFHDIVLTLLYLFFISQIFLRREKRKTPTTKFLKKNRKISTI